MSAVPGAVLLALALIAGAAGAAAPRLVLEQAEVAVDAPVWVCAEGAAPPGLLRVDGLELPDPADSARAPGAASAHPVHLVLAWPATGALPLLDGLPARTSRRALPPWGHDGRLGPGAYALSAEGFAPETLRVRAGDAAERRTRAVLARARLRADAGDSALAARLVTRLLDLEPGGPYETAAFLALGRLWRHSRYRERPEEWLAEWVARRHSSCAVEEGIRVWLESVPEPRASETLRRMAARYPDTRAAAVAARRLGSRAAPP